MAGELAGLGGGPAVASLIGYVIFVCSCPEHGVITLAVQNEAECPFCHKKWKIRKMHYTEGETPVVELVPVSSIIAGSIEMLSPGGRA